MDYTLLTAAHIHEKTPPKMDAKREQEYYENAEGTSRRFESLLELAMFPATLPSYLREMASLAAPHIRAAVLRFTYGWKEGSIM